MVRRLADWIGRVYESPKQIEQLCSIWFHLLDQRVNAVRLRDEIVCDSISDSAKGFHEQCGASWVAAKWCESSKA